MLNEISVWIGIASAIIGMVIGFASNERIKKKEAAAEGENDGKIATDLKYIKDGIDEMKKKQAIAEERNIQIITEVAELRASYKSLHKRVDAWEERINHIHLD